MGIGTGIVAFIIIWWLVLFTVLPWGIRRNENPALGEDPGAPIRHRILLRALITTGITLVIWGAMFAAIELDLFSFRDIAGNYQHTK
jgi:predicted secreted protein